MSKQFKHLNIPSHWQSYWTRFPEGHTILEALIQWVSQVDEMVDNQNKLSDTVSNYGTRLDQFIDQFEGNLSDEVKDTLGEWQQSGFLDVVINDALDTKFHEMDDRLTAQLADKPNYNEVHQELDLKRDKSVRIGFNDFDSETLGVIQDGSGGTPINVLSDPRNHSVSPIKTTFISTSTNLVNPNDIQSGKTISSTGQLDDSPHSVTGFIVVDNNENITGVGVTMVALYDRNKNFIKRVVFDLYSQPQTINTENAHFLRYVLHASYSDKPQVNRGSELLPYQDFQKPVLSKEIDIPPVPPNKTTFLRESSNLFNKETVVYNQRLHLTTGKLRQADGFSVSDFIEIQPSKEYFVNGIREVVYYDSDRNYILGREILSTVEYTETPSQARYIRFSVMNSNLTVAQLSEEKVPYEEFGYFLSPDVIVGESSFDSVRVGESSKVYKSELVEGGTPETNIDVINKFDEFLVHDHVKKEILGLDDFGNELVVYKSSQDNIDNPFGIERLKLGIMTGLHGNERNPVTGLYFFLRDLFNNPYENENFEIVKSLVDIYYIPLANPSGWNLKTRNNGHDVNLNRNFTTNWEETPDSDKGDSPASETETQLIESWMEENNFDYYLDVHTTVGVDNPWFASNQETEEGLLLINDYHRTKSILNNWWKTREDIDYPNHTLGYINDYNLNLAQSWRHAESYGTHGFLLELANRYSPDIVSFGSVSNTFASETIGNLLMQFFKRKDII